MPKVIDHDQRRRDIIDVTWGLIVKGGIEAATMREIAAEAGFANGALKHYFPGKDEIIEGAYERSLNRLGEILNEAMVGKRGIEGLRTMMTVTMPIDEEDVTAGKVLLSFWERAAFNDSLHTTYRKHLKVWRDGIAHYLREGRELGEIVTGIPDEQLIDEIVLVNAGATIMRVIAPEVTTADLLRRHVDTFIERISRP
ncbi:TetR/AcrR family transcriptional regulator [Agromyces larvae]|uniref:TetR/AcrR family transcriptional regulator n=1 Tax=Agromyces larvae TaxID=2929802 RepID=A0ABY4BYT6_9MICO|nr:TetR/AcrR family transcriptional regulator [Agromyces larvae]UOE44382.1 TetR/AcrR family transcriptional regulator [Agromyces larvae]